MKVEQIYTGCLAQGAYYIESEGEVAIIDPLREVQQYIDKANKNKAKIKYIFETHFHADFVSGHVTLAEKTGAIIIYGCTAKPHFPCHIAKDNEIFQLGKVQIQALHTPGHTMESTIYLLKDEQGKEHCIFSGDTLFLGDVGRPDLAQKGEITKEDLAGMLYDSLRKKIMPLPDDIVIYPAHGEGSACGKNMMKETMDTLGNQKKINYALREDMTKEEFIKEVTDGLLAPPKYFPENVRLNREGYSSIDKVLDKGLKALSPNQIETIVRETQAIVLDVRNELKFAKGFIPRSIFIGLDSTFAPWVGALIMNVNQPLIIVTPESREQETVTRLARVGFDNVLGYLEGGIDAWKKAGKEIDTITNIEAHELAQKNNITTVDVRRENEFTLGHVSDAIHIPLDFINEHISSVPQNNEFYIYCGTGYRSVIATSILKARGYHNMVNVLGGYNAIKETSLPKTTKEYSK